MEAFQTEQVAISKNKLTKLCRQQEERDVVLAKLIQRRKKLLEDLDVEQTEPPSGRVQAHYKYILPLVKDIHLLELKVKELQKEYEKKKLKCEAARLGQVIYGESLKDDECVLKRFARELGETSAIEAVKVAGTESEMSGLSNVTYQATSDGEYLNEDLGFTVLCSGVHIRVRITSQIPSKNFHILSRQAARIGVNSDSHVPHLEDKVRDVLAQDKHASEVVSLVAKYIEEDMAPYVLIIPMKKKGKKLKSAKSQSKKKVSADMSTGQSVKKENNDANLKTDHSNK